MAGWERPVKQHEYAIEMEWTGNNGEGTSGYKAYRRDHVYRGAGKPEIPGSSDPHFRGDATRYNPEELLVASLSSCHMLWYLHLCATNGVIVVAYRDQAIGVMNENPDGSGEFVRVDLKPVVTIAPGSDRAKAIELHHEAHSLCFIARSVNFPVEAHATIEVAESVAK